MKRLIPIVAIAAIAALASGCHFGGSAEARDAGPAVDRTYPGRRVRPHRGGGAL